MKYNNGYSQDNFYNAQIDELLERAKEYSEGNRDLELTLLNLWKQGIKTIGCCIGHAEDDPKYTDGIGYLAFRLDNQNSFKYLDMIYKMYEEQKKRDITMIIDESSESIHFPYKYRNTIFNSLKELSKTEFSNYNKETKVNQIIPIMNFSKNLNMSLEYVMKDNKIYVAIYNETEEQLKDVENSIMPIDDCSEIKFPFIVECNQENIKKINVLINNYIENNLTENNSQNIRK